MKKYLLIGFFLLVTFNVFSQTYVDRLPYLRTKRSVKTGYYDLVKASGDSVVESISRHDLYLKVRSIKIYGGGSLYKMVTSEESTAVGESSANATSPSGSLGIHFETYKLITDVYISYNGKRTVDMMTMDQFSEILMNPNNGGQSFNASIDYRLAKFCEFSFHTFVSDNIMKVNETTYVDGSPFQARFGICFHPFDFSILDATNNLDFRIDAEFVHRQIMGDFSNDDHTIENVNIKGSDNFNGFDFTALLGLNSVELYVRYSLNGDVNGERINGYSGEQITFGLNVTGDFLKIK